MKRITDKQRLDWLGSRRHFYVNLEWSYNKEIFFIDCGNDIEVEGHNIRQAIDAAIITEKNRS